MVMHYSQRGKAAFPLSPALALLGAREGAAFHFAADEVAVRDRSTPANNFLGTVAEARAAGIITFSRATVGGFTDLQGLLASAAINVPRLTYSPASLLTSATPMRIGLGARSLAVSAGAAYAEKEIATLSDSADPSRWMMMQVKSHVGGVLTGNVYRASGSGSASSWIVCKCLGYLPEPQRTNLFLRSTDLTATWAKTNCTAPAANRLTEDSSTGAHQISQSVSFTSGSVYTVTVVAEAGERTALRIGLPSAAFGSALTGTFDLSAGTATGAGATIKKVSGNRFECVLTATATATVSASPAIQMMSGGAASYTGDGSSGLYIHGLQIEVGAYPTSLIVTAGSAVTRQIDDLKAVAAKLPTISNGELTLVAKAIRGQAPTTIMRVQAASINNAMLIGQDGLLSYGRKYSAGGVLVANISNPAGVAFGSRAVDVFSAKQDLFIGASQSGQYTADTSGAALSGTLDGYFLGSAAPHAWSAPVEAVAVIPRALSQAECDARAAT